MKSKLKNIVIINDFDYVQGGASKVAIDTANLLSNNYNVIFFSADSNENSTLNDNVTKICTNQGEALKNKNKFKGFINGIYNFKAKRELKKLLLTLNKEETIIHVHGWTKCLSSSVFYIAWKLGFKVVLTMHDYFTACPNGGYFNYKKNEICHLKPLSYKCCRCNCDSRNYLFKMYRILRQFVQNKIVKLNDRLTDVISISNFSEKILKKTLNPKTRIHRVYNYIDFSENTRKVDYTKNEYYLYVGRVSKEKGVNIFCKTISELDLKGIVVGDGPELEKLKKDYPNIEYVGWKNSYEVKEYMKCAKALIFPSRLYETMGMTVIESLSVNLPVITFNNNASSSYIDDGVDGYICNITDLKKIIEKFESNPIIIKNKQKIKKKLEQFSKENYINNLITNYIKILGRNGMI